MPEKFWQSRNPGNCKNTKPHSFTQSLTNSWLVAKTGRLYTKQEHFKDLIVGKCVGLRLIRGTQLVTAVHHDKISKKYQKNYGKFLVHQEMVPWHEHNEVTVPHQWRELKQLPPIPAAYHSKSVLSHRIKVEDWRNWSCIKEAKVAGTREELNAVGQPSNCSNGLNGSLSQNQSYLAPHHTEIVQYRQFLCIMIPVIPGPHDGTPSK